MNREVVAALAVSDFDCLSRSSSNTLSSKYSNSKTCFSCPPEDELPLSKLLWTFTNTPLEFQENSFSTWKL
ncbi:hypothetical protein J1N35_038324 [Gossypium stocksii]|uniref:Uncharacterized protein n=1 Tax=Gossypium stocksii TaxID=47602 RepID=A0A9D3ZMS4_9ROSI|nr:hypothetical protein J1N35_038324 [Gossypium stocksii]